MLNPSFEETKSMAFDWVENPGIVASGLDGESEELAFSNFVQGLQKGRRAIIQNAIGEALIGKVTDQISAYQAESDARRADLELILTDAKSILLGLRPKSDTSKNPYPEVKVTDADLEERADILRWSSKLSVGTEDFLVRMADEKPFTLWFDKRTVDNPGDSFKQWNVKLKGLVERHFGPKSKRAITLGVNRFDQIQPMLDAWVQNGVVEFYADGDDQAIRVLRPEEFFIHYSRIDNVGPSACAGMLCFSTIQAVDRQNSSLFRKTNPAT